MDIVNDIINLAIMDRYDILDELSILIDFLKEARYE